MARSQLHPGAKWLFRLKAYPAGIFVAIFVVAFIMKSGSFFSMIRGGLIGGPSSIEISGLWFVVFLVIVIIIGEIYAQMTYNRWFYEFTGDNLKKEHGIIWKTFSNIPYERVQNVDITQGIIARIFKFSTIHIQTAGYSYHPKGGRTEGYIPAVDVAHAEKIREFVMKKISHKKTQGL